MATLATRCNLVRDARSMTERVRRQIECEYNRRMRVRTEKEWKSLCLLSFFLPVGVFGCVCVCVSNIES